MKFYKTLRILFIGIVLFAQSHAAIAQYATVDSILNDFYHHPERVMVTAHRSAHLVEPENSIAAIKDAIKIGVDIIEIDVRKTNDGKYVLLHDKTIDRTTNNKGEVKNYTYRQLKKIPLLQDGQPTSQRIPTLKSALKAAKGHVMIDLDFKLDTREDAVNVCKLIRKAGVQKQVLFFVYDYHYVSTLDSINSSIPVMPRAYNKEAVLDILKNYKVPVIHVDPSFYSDSLMGLIRKQNIRVWINALGKYDDMEKIKKNSGYDSLLIMKQVNVIQTNYPADLLDYLRKKGLHR